MKLDKLLRNNTFLINSGICVVVILCLCYLGISSPVKKTYSVDDSDCVITENGTTVCEEEEDEYKCYYNSTTEKFEWTNVSSTGTLYPIVTEENCNETLLELTLKDTENTLKKCLTKNSSGTCIRWDTNGNTEISIYLKPGVYTFDLENNNDYKAEKNGHKLKSFKLLSYNLGDKYDLSDGSSDGYPIVGQSYTTGSTLILDPTFWQYTLEAEWESIEEKEENDEEIRFGNIVVEEAKELIFVEAGMTESEFENEITLLTDYEMSVDVKTVQEKSVLYTGGKVTITKSNGSIYASYNVIVLGDVNGDGFIGTMDYVLIYNYFNDATKLTGIQQYAADVSNDGYVNTLDYVMIYNDWKR